jgi:hypothetical protein
MGNPSVKALRKRLSGRVADNPDKTRAISSFVFAGFKGCSR